MDTSLFSGMVDLIITVLGVYMLSWAITMKQTGKIKGGVMLPKGINVKRCKDVAGYISFIYPKSMYLGAAAVICGGIGLVGDYTTDVVPGWLYLGASAIFLIEMIWYASVSKKAIQKYWGIKY